MRKGKKPGVKKGYKRGPMSAAHRKAISEASKRRFAKQTRPTKQPADNGYIKLTVGDMGTPLLLEPRYIRGIRHGKEGTVLDIGGTAGVTSQRSVLFCRSEPQPAGIARCEQEHLDR